MKFIDFVCFDATVPELEAKARDDVIKELVSALDREGRLGKDNADKIARAVIKRENEASTGIGKGVALPHVKTHIVDNVIAVIGQSGTGIDFSALDKQLVYSVILLISPVNNPDKHLQVMESIFRYLQQEKFRNFLRQSRSSEQIHDLLVEADENSLL